MRTSAIAVLAALWLAAAGASFAATKDEAATPFVHADGTLIRDEQNRPLHLRGVNLGGWLSWEGWIFGGGFESQTTILGRLGSLVGPETAGAFRDAVHARFIAEPDIARIAAMGFNVVRVPLNCRLLEDDARPDAYKEAGWQVLDRLLGWCEAHRVYAVLDLHSAPGGQSKLFMADPADPAKGAVLWSDEACQARTVALYEDPAGLVSGYTFWTWKKAPTSHPGLMVIAPPPAWTDLMRWIGKRWFALQPTPQAASAAIRAFLDAAACDRTREDPQMRDALQPPRQDSAVPAGP
jgi:hypothetical protein